MLEVPAVSIHDIENVFFFNDLRTTHNIPQCSQAFIAKSDVEVVRRSTKGLGTDEAHLINTLCNRTKKQLDAVDLLYHKTVGRVL